MQAQQSPTEQALAERLSFEVQAVIQLRAQMITLQRELAESQIRIKELEGNPETK
jgi:hypothetical protein